MPQISINIPNAAVPRIKTMLRQYFPEGVIPGSNPPELYPEPTDAEYLAQLKELVKDYVKREMRDYERREAAAQAVSAITDIEVLD